MAASLEASSALSPLGQPLSSGSACPVYGQYPVMSICNYCVYVVLSQIAPPPKKIC